MAKQSARIALYYRDTERRLIFRLGPGSGLGQKFTNCARTILKLRRAVRKLRRLTNHSPHPVLNSLQIFSDDRFRQQRG